MATFNMTVFSIEEAIARGHDVFDVLLTDWGTSFDDRYPIIGAPPFSVFGREFPVTPAGIAIGPRSTVDRAWVSWNTQTDFPTGGVVEPWPASYRVLTHERPLMYAQPSGGNKSLPAAAPDPLADAMRLGSLYVFPTTQNQPPGTPAIGPTESTVLPDGYIKADGSAADFTPTVTPILHLQFILKRDVPPPETRRLPYNYRAGVIYNPAVAGTENLVALLPTFGRKHVYISINSEQTVTGYRVGAIRNLHPQFFTPPSPQETTEDTQVPTADGAVSRFKLENPCADYLALYVTFTNAGLSQVFYNLTAYD